MQTRGLLSVLCVVTSLLIACGGGTSTPKSSSFIPSANSSPTAPSQANGSGSSTNTAPTTSNSSIPSSATVLSNLQNDGDWADCSDCAGGAVTSSYWSGMQSSPSLSGSSRQFNVSGGPWSDVLWIRKLGAHNEATHFLWDFYVYFDNDSAAAVWSAEYDFWQAIGGQKHMIGSQCVFGENHWDVWDSHASQWVNTGIACPRFSGGQWHHIAWDVERVSSWQYRYNTLWVDDKALAIGRVFDAEPSDWDDAIGIQWQLDQNGAGTQVNEWIDKVTLTIW